MLSSLTSIFNFDITRRVMFLGAIAASVAVGISLYHWIKEPVFQPLPYSASDKNLNTIIQALDSENIEYRINDSTHTISVPAESVRKAKMSLSMAGVPKDDGFNFSYLNDESRLGGSQFLEDARYIRTLESDLARTISAIVGVSAAKVHLAIPKDNLFADEKTKTSASVVVHFNPGYENDKEKVRAIIQMIASSVPGLDPTNVAITDQYGHYLSSDISPDSLVNREQLNYRGNMQSYYEKKIQSLISPIVGVNKASVSVNIDFDFTQTEEAFEDFDPTKTTLRSEQSVSESNGSSGAAGVPGALSNQPPTNQDAPAKQAGADAGGQSRTESTKNYEVSKSMRYVKATTPKVKNISVAVIIDDEHVFDEKTKKSSTKPIAKEKLDKLNDLVKSIIGFSEQRGDRVTVINSGFLPEKIEVPEKTKLWQEPWFWDWAKRIGGILFGFIFLMVMYKKFSGDLKAKPVLSIPHSEGGQQGLQYITPEMMQLKDEQIQIVRDLVAKDPNKVASVIKKWVAK